MIFALLVIPNSKLFHKFKITLIVTVPHNRIHFACVLKPVTFLSLFFVPRHTTGKISKISIWFYEVLYEVQNRSTLYNFKVYPQLNQFNRPFWYLLRHLSSASVIIRTAIVKCVGVSHSMSFKRVPINKVTKCYWWDPCVDVLINQWYTEGIIAK